MYKLELKPDKDGNYYCPIHGKKVIPYIICNGFYHYKKPKNGCYCSAPRPTTQPVSPK